MPIRWLTFALVQITMINNWIMKWRIFLWNSRLVGYLLSSFNKSTGVLCPVLVFIGALVMEMCLKSLFQNVNVPAAMMAILRNFCQYSSNRECVWNPILQIGNVPAATMAILTFFVNGLVMEMCVSEFLKSIFQNVNVQAAKMAIWLWSMCLKSNFANVPAATMAILPISWINMT